MSLDPDANIEKPVYSNQLLSAFRKQMSLESSLDLYCVTNKPFRT